MFYLEASFSVLGVGIRGQLWCAAQINPSCRHFPEADLQTVTDALVAALVTHMHGRELAAASAAVQILHRLSSKSEATLKHVINEQMLDFLEAALPQPLRWNLAVFAMQHLDDCSRALDRLQRGRAFRLMTTKLLNSSFEEHQDRAMRSLELLWEDDEDPTANFEEAVVALRAQERNPDIGFFVCRLLRL